MAGDKQNRPNSSLSELIREHLEEAAKHGETKIEQARWLYEQIKDRTGTTIEQVVSAYYTQCSRAEKKAGIVSPHRRQKVLTPEELKTNQRLHEARKEANRSGRALKELIDAYEANNAELRKALVHANDRLKAQSAEIAELNARIANVAAQLSGKK